MISLDSGLSKKFLKENGYKKRTKKTKTNKKNRQTNKKERVGLLYF